MNQPNGLAEAQGAAAVQAESNQLAGQEKLLRRLRSERKKHVATFKRVAKSFDEIDDLPRQLQIVSELEILERAVAKLDKDINAVVAALFNALAE